MTTPSPLALAADLEAKHKALAGVIAGWNDRGVKVKLGAFEQSCFDNFPTLITALRESGEAAEIRKLLPDEMPGCKIVFKECEIGHGRLTATNWIDHGCPHCLNSKLELALRDLLDRVERNGGLGEYSGGIPFATSNAKALLRALKPEPSR